MFSIHWQQMMLVEKRIIKPNHKKFYSTSTTQCQGDHMFKKIVVISTEPKMTFEIFGLASQRSSKSIRQSYQDMQGLCGVFWGH